MLTLRPGQLHPVRDASSSSLFALPCRKEEPINNSSFPDVVIASERKLPRIAGENPGVVRQVVIEAKVSLLCIHRRQAVAGDGIAAKSLLNAENRLNSADYALDAAKRMRAVVCFNPVTLGMLPAAKLGAEPE